MQFMKKDVLFPGADHLPSKALPRQTKVIFRLLDKFWTCQHQQIFLTSMDLGGATIIFAQNWNFELKFVLVNSLVKKMGSMGFLNPLKPKNVSKTARNCQLAATSFFSQIWNFKLKIFLVDSHEENRLYVVFKSFKAPK